MPLFVAGASVSLEELASVLEAVVGFWLEDDVSVLDSGSSEIGCTGDLSVLLFFFPRFFTITGFAVTVRATIELLLFASATPALASCDDVIAGTAGASGLVVSGDDEGFPLL